MGIADRLKSLIVPLRAHGSREALGGKLQQEDSPGQQGRLSVFFRVMDGVGMRAEWRAPDWVVDETSDVGELM